MNTIFFINLNMKTADGFDCFGRFDIGYNREFALTLFSQLVGQPAKEDTGVLHLDLVEEYRGLPLDLKVISCSMEEVCTNMKMITRELFRQRSLNEAKK